MSNCLCPIFKTKESDACGLCLQTGLESKTPSTKLYVQLKNDCQLGHLHAARNVVLSVFHVKLSPLPTSLPPQPESKSSHEPEKSHATLIEKNLFLHSLVFFFLSITLCFLK